ncbi:hypothetical protein T4E_9571 [Trichinella pseudospiralis]|uniref:Uncharacterized protein n=1 Tax=Trichinella pseudospiralis TaxID=6337 RepID=A0A0V0YJD2_TRIPS|nr:hypothetical protein T4E_9571 [Trichinella pseudospiralis]
MEQAHLDICRKCTIESPYRDVTSGIVLPPTKVLSTPVFSIQDTDVDKVGNISGPPSRIVL